MGDLVWIGFNLHLMVAFEGLTKIVYSYHKKKGNLQLLSTLN